MSMQGTWSADPYRHHQYRYWDGARWTSHVADAGMTSEDAVAAVPSSPTPPQSMVVSTSELSTPALAAREAPPAPIVGPVPIPGGGVTLAGKFYVPHPKHNGRFVEPVSVCVAAPDVWIVGRRIPRDVFDRTRRRMQVVLWASVIGTVAMLAAGIAANDATLAVLAFVFLAAFLIVGTMMWRRATDAAREEAVHFPAVAVEPVKLRHNWQNNPGLWVLLLGVLPGLLAQWIVALARGRRKIIFYAPIEPGEAPRRLRFKTNTAADATAFAGAIQAAAAVTPAPEDVQWRAAV